MTTKRPVFLTVLCILSFVGIGISLLVNIYNLNAFAQQSLSGFDFFGAFNPTVKAMLAFFKYLKLTVILKFVFDILCLVGVILMFKLNKKGYYIYIVGELAPVIMIFIARIKFQDVINLLPETATTMLSWPILLLIMAVAVLFSVLYGLNLRHMK